jgi:ATP-binding cassette subfamily F protein 3
MHNHSITSYPGNFQQYWRLRRERYDHQLKAWEAQQEQIEKQEDYIRRVHYGQLHKQAQSRRKALDRLERLERPTLVEGPQMHFGAVRRSGDIVVEAEEVGKAFDRPLFKDLSFSLRRGQRLGILGPNGSGKTTLLRVLLGEMDPDTGSVRLGHLVQVGYYDQHLQILPDDKNVFDAVWPGAEADRNDQDMRNLLSRFGLVGERVYQQVRALSGGERSRAALARLVASGVNLLVLDEPTNHLDLWACDALEQALLDFEGAAIVVSHDRYFLNRVADLLIVLEGNGQARIIHGNYDTYERMRLLWEAEAKTAAAKKVAAPSAAPAATTPAPPRRKRRFPYRKVEDLEADIAAAETRLREVEALLASPELYREGDRVKETTRAFEETKARLQQLYEHWEEAVELS